jgi:hypothetical protein
LTPIETITPTLKSGDLRVAGRQAGVSDDDSGEPVGVLRHHPQPDEAAPVLAEQGRVLDVEVVEQQRAHPLDVPGV